LDMNRLGQRGPTEYQWEGKVYADRARAFGWHAIEIDGHDLAAIDAAYAEAAGQADRPTLIVARTLKGKGVAEVENKEGWHGKALPADLAKTAIQELGGERSIRVDVHKPAAGSPAAVAVQGGLQLPRYDSGTSAATRNAYGDALKALGAARADVVGLDGEVGNSTFTETFANAFPDRFFEQYIAEQQMVASAVGLSVRHYNPFAATFAAFFTRAYDFIRMAAVSQANIKLVGSHAGVSIGEDGPSQMALEDLAMMRAVSGSTVLYPCDANQTAHLMAEMAERAGIVYLRTTREKTPVIYGADERFPIGGSRVVRQSAEDKVAVIAAGITLHEALKAYDQLKGAGIPVRVIDAYSVKPIDAKTLLAAARDTGGRLVVVEDHWFEGGLGDAVLDAFAGGEGAAAEQGAKVIKLAVRAMPGSGKPEELMDAAGISASHIVAAVKQALG
ncbi:MAG TPA: transketolase, partial [Ktedonobacterales bacterium]